jgi:hypothetical protein
MSKAPYTNASIHSHLACAADAISRARDNLKERDKQTIVGIYSFQQMGRAVQSLLSAYRIALENSVLCHADIDEIMQVARDLTELMDREELLPDIVEPSDIIEDDEGPE